MARKPRLHFPGAVYHVILGGNGGQPVFLNSSDRTRLLLLLQEGSEKFGHRIHAFCFLPTEIRLVVEVGQLPLSRIMQHLGFRYTRWFNARHGRAGHLFQGRYRALLIDPQTYLLDLVCALHRAPLVASLTDDPLRYVWTSHRAYCGREQIPWLTCARTLAQTAETGVRAQLRFHARVDAIEVIAADFLRGGSEDPRILGNPEFVSRVMKLARQEYRPRIDPEGVLRLVCERYGLSEEELAAPGKDQHRSEARALIASVFLQTDCATLTSLGVRLGRDVSSLSSAVRRLRLRAKQDEELSGRLRSLMNQVLR
jgi:REP element-mobilizing transposase RayT